MMNMNEVKAMVELMVEARLQEMKAELRAELKNEILMDLIKGLQGNVAPTAITPPPPATTVVKPVVNSKSKSFMEANASIFKNMTSGKITADDIKGTKLIPDSIKAVDGTMTYPKAEAEARAKGPIVTNRSKSSFMEKNAAIFNNMKGGAVTAEDLAMGSSVSVATIPKSIKDILVVQAGVAESDALEIQEAILTNCNGKDHMFVDFFVASILTQAVNAVVSKAIKSDVIAIIPKQ